MTARPSLTADQAGLTLVDLVISSAVAVLVMVGVAAMFAQGLRAQASTVDGDTATGRTQLVTMSLEQALRNARKATISADGRTVAAEVLAGGTWRCQRWSLAVHATDPLQNTLTLTAGGTTTVLATGARPVGGSLFGPPGTTVDFGGRITYNLRVNINESSAEAVGAILLHGAGAGGATC